jgi:hypothetical protein
MKSAVLNFFATLAAILVAAAVIVVIKSCVDEQDRLALMRAETERMERESAAVSKLTKEYESRSKALGKFNFEKEEDSPTPTQPEIATLKRPAVVHLKYGTATLSAGTKLQIVSRNGAILIVDYLGEKIEVPADATDRR